MATRALSVGLHSRPVFLDSIPFLVVGGELGEGVCGGVYGELLRDRMGMGLGDSEHRNKPWKDDSWSSGC